MNEKSWQSIWSDRVVKVGENPSLDMLIKADGFDQGIGDIDAKAWVSICDNYANLLKLTENMSIFEFGCGAGAFLKPFYDKYRLNVAGVDLSSSLIEIAKNVLPHGQFEVCSAQSFIPLSKFDVVAANSVIHYFQRDELSAFLQKTLTFAKQFVLISDIPNLYKMSEAEGYRKKIMQQKGIESKYEGLSHTYYKPDELISFFKDQNWLCEVVDLGIEGSRQSSQRFSILAKKIS